MMQNYEYLVSKTQNFHFSNTLLLHGLYLHWNNLEVYHNKNITDEIVLIGDIFSSENPNLSLDEIAEKLLKIDHSIKDFIAEIDNLAGRFLVIYIKSDGMYVFTDATASIPVVYSKEFESIASNPVVIKNMFNLKDSVDAKKILKFSSRNALPYDLSIVEGVKYCLPNHYLDAINFKVFRYPTSPITEIDIDSAVEISHKLIKNIIESITTKYEICLPLTAGMDSRVLLSYLPRDTIAFTYKHRWMNMNHQDIRIPRLITKTTNNKYEIFETKSLSEDLKFEYKNAMGMMFSESAAQNAYTYSQTFLASRIFLSPNIIPFVKSKFGKKLPEVFAGYRFLNTRTYNYSNLNKKYIKEWHKAAKSYSKMNNLSLYDLFYWEVRYSKWVVNGLINYDYLTKSIDFCNCRKLILTWLAIPRKVRFTQSFHSKLLLLNNPSLLDFDFNPDDKRKFFLKNSALYYLICWAHYIINKTKYLFK